LPKLSLWRRMQIPFVAAFVNEVMRVIGPTLKLQVVGVHNAIQIPRSGEPAIGVFWHRCIFPAAWVFRNREIVVLNTVNFDGQWTRRVIEKLGFGTVQGSSSRGAIEGLTGLAKCLAEGKHVALTIDGPRGPRYVAKPGAVILARRTGCPVSAFYVAVERGITFKRSWDLFRLPLPYSRIALFVAPPIYVPAATDAEAMKEKQAEVQSALERVRDAAESWFTLTEEEQEQVRDEWSDGIYRRRREAAARRREMRALSLAEYVPYEPEAEGAPAAESDDADPQSSSPQSDEE
jgi:lysophospholipid acyltransferase (LPLAT)-like uncharacterized protein